jgi:hypothetical protein
MSRSSWVPRFIVVDCILLYMRKRKNTNFYIRILMEQSLLNFFFSKYVYYDLEHVFFNLLISVLLKKQERKVENKKDERMFFSTFFHDLPSCQLLLLQAGLRCWYLTLFYQHIRCPLKVYYQQWRYSAGILIVHVAIGR